MANILRQRDIIDRRALARGLGAGHWRPRRPPHRSPVLLPPLKAALCRGRDEIRRRFEADGTAARAVCEQCFLIDH